MHLKHRSTFAARTLTTLAFPLLFASTSCASHPAVVHDTRIVLREPSTLPDLAVRQHLAVTAGDKHGEFDAVLQKQGDSLVVVGLGPAGVRAFVLRQTATGVTFDQRFGPPLPFPPERIVLDIHRVFFRQAPPPPHGEGEATAVVDGESLVERWQGGSLRERHLHADADPAREFPGEDVTIRFGEGCTVEHCRPKTVTLRNESRDYTLTIDNEEYL